jgi:hypothetical protein
MTSLCNHRQRDLAVSNSTNWLFTSMAAATGKHDLTPWLNFFLAIIRRACAEFEQRAGQIKSPRGAKPERADVVHDLLAFLAEQMMSLNREKRAAGKQFLIDLGDFHGIDVHALKPKTKLDKFWKLEAAEVFAHLRGNAKALAAQNIRLKDSDEEQIRDRFQKSKAKLLPLETKIRFTDDLIDEIVFQLYALTAEEIQIVKGATK